MSLLFAGWFWNNLFWGCCVSLREFCRNEMFEWSKWRLNTGTKQNLIPGKTAVSPRIWWTHSCNLFKLEAKFRTDCKDVLFSSIFHPCWSILYKLPSTELLKENSRSLHQYLHPKKNTWLIAPTKPNRTFFLVSSSYKLEPIQLTDGNPLNLVGFFLDS